MQTNFEQLDQEKRERIIRAAIRVFAKSSYKDASTDDIVKEAGISKGSLFYYFQNKKNLYIYIFNYVLGLFKDEVFRAIDINEPDFIVRIQQVVRAKLSLSRKYEASSMLEFLLNSHFDDIEDIRDELESKLKEYKETGYEMMFKNIDYSRFREDIDPKLAINTIYWTLESYAETSAKAIANEKYNQDKAEELFAGIGDYMKLLKKAFYKEDN